MKKLWKKITIAKCKKCIWHSTKDNVTYCKRPYKDISGGLLISPLKFFCKDYTKGGN